MKFSVVLLLGLILGACQKEPEVVDVNKLVRCAFSNKSAIKKDACDSLNGAEKKVLACATSKGKSMNSECKDVSLAEMRFFKEREPAKQRGTQFKLNLNDDNE